MARQHVYRGLSKVVQQHRPFERLLSANNDRTALPLERIKAHPITGMRRGSWREDLCVFARDMLEVWKADR
jgi:hypothetical protein